MAFFDKLSAMAKNAVDKTNEMMEVNSLNSKITAETKKISEIKMKIGEYYWQKFIENASELDIEPAGYCEEIKELEEKIALYKAEIQQKKEASRTQGTQAQTQEPLQQGIRCQNCGSINGENVRFCGECGAKLEIITVETETEKEEEPAKPVCTCGAVNPPDTKFCGECGKALS